MPIDRKKFEQGIGNIGYMIFKFLAKDPNNAYSMEEIINGINYFGDANAFAIELIKLKKRGIVIDKFLDGEFYYTLSADTLRNIKR